MTSKDNDRDKPPSRSGAIAPHEEKAPSSGSWVAALKTRLGLSQGASLRETIEDALAEPQAKGSAATNALSTAEREMLQRTLRFGTLKVEDIMVPRSDIIAIDEGESLQALLQQFDDAGVSRVPLFSETLDDPKGMVHIKDLLRLLMGDAAGRPALEGRGMRPKPGETAPPAATLNLANADLSKPISTTKLKRPVLFVPPSMSATNLLIRMQTRRIHMALVVDEYGGTDGLVTIEDLVEQIVGEIEDEHDEIEAANITADAGGWITASARTPVRELEERLDIKLLPEDQAQEIDTLGGLVFALVGHVPARGELVPHPSGIEFEVLDADARRIKRLKVHHTKQAAPPSRGSQPAKP